MAKSLQEQLLGAGIVDAKKAKQVKQEKRKQNKQNKQRPKGEQVKTEAQQWAEQSRAEKVEKDKALNRQREDEALKKAIAAQIKQLIERHRLDRKGGEEGYQFADGSVIKKVYVTAQQFNLLVNGRLAVVRLGEGYELVPKPVAEKIQERDAEAVVVLNAAQADAVDEDDPYKDYVIPDDLMW